MSTLATVLWNGLLWPLADSDAHSYAALKLRPQAEDCSAALQAIMVSRADIDVQFAALLPQLRGMPCAERTALERLAEAVAQNTHPAANRTPELNREARKTWEPIDNPKLVIDTDDNLDSCVDQALHYLMNRIGDARHRVRSTKTCHG